jgi:hypothetical protein
MNGASTYRPLHFRFAPISPCIARVQQKGEGEPPEREARGGSPEGEGFPPPYRDHIGKPKHSSMSPALGSLPDLRDPGPSLEYGGDFPLPNSFPLPQRSRNILPQKIAGIPFMPDSLRTGCYSITYPLQNLQKPAMYPQKIEHRGEYISRSVTVFTI